MKKVIRLLALTLAMIFVLACAVACNDNTTTDDKNDANKTKTYIIATDTVFAPFEFTDADGKFVGVDVEILEAIAKDQGFKYELQSVGFNAAVTALETNNADGVIAGMSITDKRKEKYNFSDPYYDSGVVMAIAATDETTKSYQDLKDKTVAVKQGTEGQTFAESIKDQYGFTVQVYDQSGLMYEAVKSGSAVACFEDYPVVGYGISQGNGLKMVTAMEKGSSYGFAVLKGAGNDELVEMFNKGLANIKANGTYEAILNKYISVK